MKRLIPSFIKPAIRYVYYKQQRAKVSREPEIRRKQNERIREYDPHARKLILFLIEGADWDTGLDRISGGIISIVSLCQESNELKSIHGAETIMCTLPDQHLLQKHTLFNNETDVFRFAQLKGYFKEVQELIIHIPEYLSGFFLDNIRGADRQWLKRIAKKQINVMNQNVQLMPPPSVIGQLKEHASLVTITTAHDRYCSLQFRQLYDVPLHKFSVWISPEKYFFRSYGEKENLVVVSPDDHPSRDRVMEKLSSMPGMRVQVIRNLTYEQYKETISRAKWAVTFGEGLDGYFIEPIFSGAIGFAVYNEEFFTDDFKNLPGIYPSFAGMADKIVQDMKRLDDPVLFGESQQQQYDICASYYSHLQYKENIAAFYSGNYTFL